MGRDTLSAARRAQSDATTEVRELFEQWCEIAGHGLAYGVHDWDLTSRQGEEILRIVQDTSARCCFNSEEHELPALWLDLEPEARAPLMKRLSLGMRRAELAETHEEQACRLLNLQADQVRIAAEMASIDVELAALPAPMSTPSEL